MKNLLVREIFAPMLRRVGSIIAGALLALGATSDIANQVELLLPALGAFLADLLLSHLNRGRS